MFERLKSFSRILKLEIKIYQLILKDTRTPLIAKLLLGFAVLYLLLPFDIFPDFIPLVGQIDDVIVVPALVIIALKFIPKNVLDDARNIVKVQSEVAISYLCRT